MKKEIKIRVPDKDYCDPFSVGYTSDFTRKEINELIQKKAVELGYRIYHDNVPDWVLLFYDGAVMSWVGDIHEFDPDESFQEITWQDFLKLTPKDVEVQDDILDQEDVDQICRVAMGSENNNIESIITDRNEKAWDLYVALIASGELSKKGFPELGNKIDFLIDKFDDYLKQAGERK